MKKTQVIISTFLLFITTFTFCTEITAGLTYDTHLDSFMVGTELSLEESFKDNSSLSAKLIHLNSGPYAASLIYSKLQDLFIFSGGLNYTITPTAIIPFITSGAGIILRDFSLLASSGVNLNPENIFDPDQYTCSADVLLDSGESIIDLSFLYNLKKAAEGIKSSIGGGLLFTAYQNGAPAEICIMTDVQYIKDEIDGHSGLAVNAGAGINVYLSFMSIKLKAIADAINPARPSGTAMPYFISLSTGWKL